MRSKPHSLIHTTGSYISSSSLFKAAQWWEQQTEKGFIHYPKHTQKQFNLHTSKLPMLIPTDTQQVRESSLRAFGRAQADIQKDEDKHKFHTSLSTSVPLVRRWSIGFERCTRFTVFGNTTALMILTGASPWTPFSNWQILSDKTISSQRIWQDRLPFSWTFWLVENEF